MKNTSGNACTQPTNQNVIKYFEPKHVMLSWKKRFNDKKKMAKILRNLQIIYF